MYQRRGKHESAIKDFQRSIELSSKPNDSAHASLGKLLRKLGRCDDAVSHLERAIQINSKRHGTKLKPELDAATKCSQRLADIRRVLGAVFETQASFENVPESQLRHAAAYLEDITHSTPYGHKLLVVRGLLECWREFQ